MKKMKVSKAQKIIRRIKGDIFIVTKHNAYISRPARVDEKCVYIGNDENENMIMYKDIKKIEPMEEQRGRPESKNPKTENSGCRFTEKEMKKIQHVVEFMGISVSRFISESAVEKADKIIDNNG